MRAPKLVAGPDSDRLAESNALTVTVPFSLCQSDADRNAAQADVESVVDAVAVPVSVAEPEREPVSDCEPIPERESDSESEPVRNADGVADDFADSDGEPDACALPIAS
jgi:hypothetical protein